MEEITLHARNYYESIYHVSFEPLSLFPLVKVREKGEVRSLKLFGKQFFKRTAEEDLYAFRGSKLTLDEVARELYRAIIKDGKVYYQARVCIKFKNGATESKYFDSNEDGIVFLNELKEKCKKYENFLD